MASSKVFLLLAALAVAYVSADVEIEPSEVASHGRQARQASTVTITSTVTVSTSTVAATLVNGVCASLVNVTGACRRRRGLWQDRPIVLAFDDDVEHEIERYFSPTGIYAVERTSVPEYRTFGRNAAIPVAAQPDSSRFSEGSAQYIPVWIPYFGAQTQSRNANPLFFNQLVNFFQNLGTQTVTTTTTFTSTSTSFITVTTSTKPFILQGCTPSPFPFTRC